MSSEVSPVSLNQLAHSMTGVICFHEVIDVTFSGEERRHCRWQVAGDKLPATCYPYDGGHSQAEALQLK